MKVKTKNFICKKTRKPYKAPAPVEIDDIEAGTQPPTLRHSWDFEVGEWVLDNGGLDDLKEKKLVELKKFRDDYEVSTESKCVTTVETDMGEPIVVNARRMDLDNLRTLLEHIEINGVAETQIKDFENNFQTVSDTNLAIIVDDLRAHGLGLYQYCWDMQDLIENATTFEEIDIEFVYNGVESQASAKTGSTEDLF